MNQFASLDPANPMGMAAALSPADFQAIADLLHHEARIALTPQKATLVRSRLARRLRIRGVRNFSDYIRLVGTDPEEKRAMIEALTTNHTHFFRESHHFDHLAHEMVPQWRARSSREPIRIWSAACSSGEEVYSIAMTLLGRERREALWAKQRPIRLLATDISSEMVAAVRAASYARAGLDQIPAPYRPLWTRETADGFVIADEARDMVTPLVLNLFDRWPMRHRFDAIFCRNVMIYFNEATKAELTARLVAQLAPGGALYIGHSERLLPPEADYMIPAGHTIYVKPEDKA